MGAKTYAVELDYHHSNLIKNWPLSHPNQDRQYTDDDEIDDWLFTERLILMQYRMHSRFCLAYVFSRLIVSHLVFWGPRSFQFDLEMNFNIYCMYYIIREDYWRP
jgi:hypothetical protein